MVAIAVFVLCSVLKVTRKVPTSKYNTEGRIVSAPINYFVNKFKHFDRLKKFYNEKGFLEK